MGKHKVLNTRYIYKINSAIIERSKGHVKIDNIQVATKNRLIVGIGDSTGLRMIREITGSKYDEKYIDNIKKTIKEIKKKSKFADPNEKRELKKAMKHILHERSVATLEQNICNVVFSSNKQYEKYSQNGFMLNGKEYTLLLGTPGGIKQNSVLFCEKSIYNELWKRIINGADLSVPMTPSKLMGYMSLIFSSSIPVTNTRRVLVVKDVETKFNAPVTKLDFSEELDRPIKTLIPDEEIVVNAGDGCGLINPKLADEWDKDLELNYKCTTYCVRNSWTKGLLTRFDFRKYCNEVIGQTKVVDVWGVEHDINDIDIILNESMLKFYKAYKSIDHYMDCCESNGYCFSVTKSCPNTLDKSRTLNYQYIQCLDLDDNDIQLLIKDDINEIKDVIGLDYRKTILFGKGTELNSRNVWNKENLDDLHMKALMIDGNAIKDEYIKYRVQNAIRKQIDMLKTGKIRVDGNYQFAIGEPVIQLESMFGLEPVGLLSANEFYMEYWREQGVQVVSGFRSPMSCKENARVMNVVNRDEVVKWYGDLKNIIVFNAWDTAMMAFNGLDFDGDIVFTSDNPILAKGIFNLPAISCVGKVAAKKSHIPKEDYIECIAKSFGNKVGSVTNFGSSCYDTLALFDKGSAEYEEIDYRIQCTQFYQQECIDSAKNGEPPRPIPAYWHNYNAKEFKDDTILNKNDLVLYKNVITEKKPYFFTYIYDAVKKDYRNFQKNANTNCISRFRCTIGELYSKEYKTEEELEFLKWYELKNPVSTNPCIVNKIAWMVENNFNNLSLRVKNCDYDYSMYKSKSCDTMGTAANMRKIKSIYDEFKRSRINQYTSIDYADKEERVDVDNADYERVREEMLRIIPSEQELLNTLLYMSYEKKSITRVFTWIVCGEVIIENMLANKDGLIQYPVKCNDGDIVYKGCKFKMAEGLVE